MKKHGQELYCKMGFVHEGKFLKWQSMSFLQSKNLVTIKHRVHSILLCHLLFTSPALQGEESMKARKICVFMEAPMNTVQNTCWVYLWKSIAINPKKNTFKMIKYWIVCSLWHLSPGAVQWLIFLQLINGSNVFFYVC